MHIYNIYIYILYTMINIEWIRCLFLVLSFMFPKRVFTGPDKLLGCCITSQLMWRSGGKNFTEQRDAPDAKKHFLAASWWQGSFAEGTFDRGPWSQVMGWRRTDMAVSDHPHVMVYSCVFMFILPQHFMFSCWYVYICIYIYIYMLRISIYQYTSRYVNLCPDHCFRLRPNWPRFAGAASVAPLITGITTCALAAVLCLGCSAAVVDTWIRNKTTKKSGETHLKNMPQ